MKKVYLDPPWRMNYDEDGSRYELEHLHSGIFYLLQDLRGFQSLDGWISHVERTANAKPGSFHQALTGEFNGKYRQANSSVYSGSITSPGPSAGRPSSRFAGASKQAILHALHTGQISASDAANALAYGLAGPQMTTPQLTPYSGLGGGYSSAQALASAQHQAMLMMQAMAPSVSHGPPHEPTKLKPDGMHPGEIIAWRAWNIRDSDLVSVVASVAPWSPTEPMKGDAAAGYGVHAYKGPHGPLLDGYVTKSKDSWVIGEIALWGDIIEHEEGYRAEYGRVHSLVTWSENVPKLQRQMIEFKYLTSKPAFKIEDAA